jgi:geranylgeranyl reductase family protein
MPQLGPPIRDNLMKGAEQPSSTLDAPWLTMDAGKMQKRRDFDVVVVGGGPSGASAAHRLSVGGASVAVVDGSHPREKPCGGGVTARALERIGAGVADLPSGVPIDMARFAFGERAVTMRVRGADEPPRLVVLPRREFDRWLLDRAAGAGAAVIGQRVTAIERAAQGWRVVTRDGEVRGRLLVGADGPGSLVRRRVSEPFAREDLSIAAGYFVAGSSSNRIDIALESQPPGYFWSFPRPDHLAVGACAQADVSRPETLLAIADGWLNRHAPGAPRKRYGWPIPSLRVATLERQRPAGDGWLLVGDAAGLVDPITREGIFFALASGEEAAEAILEGSDPAARYVQRLRDTIYAELVMAARIKARFYQPRFMALLLSALERSGRIRDIMADLIAGDQPYHALKHRLLRTFEWKLMVELFGIRYRT